MRNGSGDGQLNEVTKFEFRETADTLKTEALRELGGYNDDFFFYLESCCGGFKSRLKHYFSRQDSVPGKSFSVVPVSVLVSVSISELESNPRQGVVIASDCRLVQEPNRDQSTLFAADDLGADSFVAEKVIIGSVAALVAWTDKKRRNWSKWKREKKKRGKK